MAEEGNTPELGRVEQALDLDAQLNRVRWDLAFMQSQWTQVCPSGSDKGREKTATALSLECDGRPMKEVAALHDLSQAYRKLSTDLATLERKYRKALRVLGRD